VSGAIAGAGLLVAAVFALAAAALRAAALTGATGLERALAAAPLGVAVAVSQALALGTVGLGGSQLALAALACATWLIAWRWLPRPATLLSAELSRWLGGEPGAAGARRPLGGSARLRLAVAAGLAGLWAGWVVWALRFPHLGLDGSTYHLSAVADWVTSGATGHSEDLYVSIPVGSYPLTNEAALAWAVGLADTWAPVAVWSASIGALLVASSWLGLRRLAIPRALAGLAIAALLLVPLVLRGLVHAETDVPALAWLACTAALVACASRRSGPSDDLEPQPARPGLLAPAIVAAALAVGTKTTTLPLAALVVAIGLFGARQDLRRLARPLAIAAVLGFVAGGLWYLRNLIAHGSPLWPFVAAPWGDPVPPLLDRVDFSLLERPRETLEGQWPIYRLTLSGGLVLLAGGLLAPIWSRRREVAAAALVTLAALIAWASAPFTGAGAAAFLQVNTLRYLIPALAAGGLALALSGRFEGRSRAWVALALAVALGWSVKTYLDDAYLPGEATLFAATLVAAAITAALARAAPRLRALPLFAAVGATALIAAGGDSYVERHAQAKDFTSGITNYFAGQERWRDGSAPIAFSPTPIAPLAGNRLRHPLDLIDSTETCAQVRARVAEGWVVVRDVDRELFGTLPAEQCLATLKPAFDDGVHRVYGDG
jgi:hypothetical protein